MYEVYLALGTGLHFIPSLSKQRGLIASKNDEEVMPDVAIKKHAWGLKGLLLVEKLNQTDKWKKLYGVQDACRSEETAVAGSEIVDSDDIGGCRRLTKVGWAWAEQYYNCFGGWPV